MNKTLKLIQTLAKIGKIISTIIFILCIVGAAGCFLGLVGCAIFGSINFGDKSLVDIIYEQTGKEMNMAEVYLQLIAGIVACAVECILAKFAQIYFTHELEVGHPFTLALAKEMFRLAILSIAIPLGSMMIVGIIGGIYSLASGNSIDLDADNGSAIGTGIALLIMSLLCKYGAQIREQQVQVVEEPVDVQ